MRTADCTPHPYHAPDPTPVVAPAACRTVTRGPGSSSVTEATPPCPLDVVRIDAALVQLADVVSLLFLGLARANALALNDTGECPLVWLIYLKQVPVNDHLRLPALLVVRAV